MQTECNPDLFGFAPVEGHRVEAAFDAGLLTSDAGALLLGATDKAVGLRASSWMASPLLARGLAQLCEGGELDTLIESKRAEAAARMALARTLLGLPASDTAVGFHLWLPMPDPQTALTFVGNAAARGVVLTAPDVVQVSADAVPGGRLCLGGPADRKMLASALRYLNEIYQPTTWHSVV